MKLFRFMTILLIATTMFFTACDGDGGTSGNNTTLLTFNNATAPGQSVSITVGAQTVDMIYANNLASITFPFSPSAGSSVDNNPATLSRKFFMSETLVTNALIAEVLNWAKTNNRISESGTDNLVSAATVKYGNQELLDLDYSSEYMKISYSNSTQTFTVASGFENHPVVCVSWYGAIMFCNWLTEMRDDSNTNCVYNEPDTTWDHTETTETAANTGYRLPSSEEWEYAARYIGTTVPTQGNLQTEYVARNVNSGHTTLTAGYYWTPADYASGAIRDYTNTTETRAVGWYSGDPDMGASNKLMPVAQKTANKLGLYDMSGNVREWCFTASGSFRVYRGGSWNLAPNYLRVSYWNDYAPIPEVNCVGFRFARTQ